MTNEKQITFIKELLVKHGYAVDSEHKGTLPQYYHFILEDIFISSCTFLEELIEKKITFFVAIENNKLDLGINLNFEVN